MATRSSKPRFSQRFRGIAQGYRSGLEEQLAEQLKQAGVEAEYESTTIRYEQPASQHRYTPDFVLPNGIIVESKGRFAAQDRKKHLLVQQQHPHLDIRFVFNRSASRIAKGSKTTYADWCRKHGFKFADKCIPLAWINEPSDSFRITALLKVKA